MTSQKPDEELVREIQDGEILSFEELVKRYQSRLRHFVFRYTHNERDAEEIVQDSFVKCYLAIDRVDTSRKFSTYLFEITKNTAISFLRKTKIELPLEEGVVAEEHETHLEKLAKKDDSEKVRHAVELLPEKYRSIVKLYYFEDLSYEEIGQKLNIPLNTVRTLVRRGKGRLKRGLTRDR
jgi:RNA polymerase sigma-70 factor (ECF subfamily)